MRRAVVLALLASCGGTAEPAGLLVDLAPGQGASNPTFIANGEDVYIETSAGTLWRRRGAGALEQLASPQGGSFVAATSNGAFLLDGSEQLSFCDADACTPLGIATGDGYVANDAFYFPGRMLETPCLMRSDGGAATCVIPGYVIEEAIAFGDGALFRGATGEGTAEGVWSWDGTGDPVLLVADMTLPFAKPAGAYFATSTDGTAAQIWQTDGTIAGTTQIGEVPIDAGADSIDLVAVSTGVYVRAHALWFVDAGGGTQLSTTAGGSAPLGDDLVFFDSLGIWRTDGTVAGTVMVAEMSNPVRAVSTDAAVYVASTVALWRIDADPRAVDVPFVIDPATLTPAGPRAYVAAGARDALDAWVDDPTTGTAKLEGVGAPRSSSPSGFTRIGDVAYFNANGGVVRSWRSDGTADGTVGLGPADATYLDAGGRNVWVLGSATVYWVAADGASTMIASGVTSLAAWGDQAVATFGASPALLTSTGEVNGLTAPSPPTAMLAIGDTMYACSDAGLMTLARGAADFTVLDPIACDALWRVGDRVFTRAADGLHDTDGHLLVAGAIEDVDPSGLVFAGGLYHLDGTRIGTRDWTGAHVIGRVTGGLVFAFGEHLWSTSGGEPVDLTGGGALTCGVVVNERVWAWIGDQPISTDGAFVRAEEPLPGFDPGSCAIVQLGDRVLYRGHDDANGDELWSAPTE